MNRINEIEIFLFAINKERKKYIFINDIALKVAPHSVKRKKKVFFFLICLFLALFVSHHFSLFVLLLASDAVELNGLNVYALI